MGKATPMAGFSDEIEDELWSLVVKHFPKTGAIDKAKMMNLARASFRYGCGHTAKVLRAAAERARKEHGDG
jgi:hypothetical protein